MVGKLLEEKGYAQENLGDIDSQSIAGAISTGTHGTGITFGSLSTQVIEITAVLSTGESIVCSQTENVQYWRAFSVVSWNVRYHCKNKIEGYSSLFTRL